MQSATRWAGIVVALLVASAAHADRVAVVPPKLIGGQSGMRDSLRASLEGGVVAAGHDAIAAEHIARAESATPAMAKCETEVCLRRFGELTDAQAVLRAVIEVLGSSNYNFHLELVDVHGGHPLQTLDDVCSICTAREANEELSSAAATLMRRFSPSVPATPALAVAVTPPAPVKKHARPYTARGRAFLGTGITAILLGHGLVDAGAALVLIDGRNEGTHTDGGVIEETRLHSLVPGAVLVGVGGLALIGGSLLVWRATLARE